MAEIKKEHNIIISKISVPAIRDDMVLLEIVKLAPWFEIHWNRQRLTHGITVIPSGTFTVEIPVDGVVPGEPVTPGQLADLLIGLMSTILPTCKVFVESVEDDFGFDSEKKKEDF